MDFEKAKNTYRKNAVVQKKMAENLVLYLIKTCGKNYDKIFEIGSGTGFLTDEIRKNLNFNEIILNDITDNFTNFEPNNYIKGDILKAKVPNECDLIISNAVFQWIDDYDFLFQKLKTSLKKNGILCFSTFGTKNFSQIKNITGLGLNYPDLKNIIKKTGFEILFFEEELQTVYFNSVKELLSHIKLTGVKTENKIWTKSDFKNFEENYSKNYKDDMGFELTYHPYFYILKN